MKLEIPATRTTPSLHFDALSQTLVIKGESYPENSVAFYHPILEEVERHLQESTQPFSVRVELAYFNTSSSKCLLDLFTTLEKFHSEARPVTVEWCYDKDDEDLEESGTDFSLETKINFRLVPN